MLGIIALNTTHHTRSNKTKVIHEIEVYEHIAMVNTHQRNVYMLIMFLKHVLEKILYSKNTTRMANKVSKFNYDDSLHGAKTLRISAILLQQYFIAHHILFVKSHHVTVVIS